MSLDFLLWIAIAYISGSLPWSVWLSKHFAHVDPRIAADGNPGAANAFRAAGLQVGLAVLVLDFLKAFIPVLLAKWALNFPDNQLFWIALAPILGHAFSVFLRFRGGRGLTSLFGVWAGLTLYEVPLVMGIVAILTTRFIKNDELKTLLIPIATAIYLLVRQKPVWMVGLVLAQLLLMLVKISHFYLSAARQPRENKV